MPRKQCRVMVADADPAAAAELSARLQQEGYRVSRVGLGAEVLRRCTVSPPDVLILDVHLPDMDGFDLCAYLRHELADAEITVIMLSAPMDELTRTSFGRMVDFVGGDYFFAKPYDAHLLVKLLNELVAETPAPAAVAQAFPTHAAWPTAR